MKIWRCQQCAGESCVKVQQHNPITCHVEATPQDTDWRVEFTIDSSLARQVIESTVGIRSGKGSGRGRGGLRIAEFSRITCIPVATVKNHIAGNLDATAMAYYKALAISDDLWIKTLFVAK